MAELCDRRNPITRAGLTQGGRHLAERVRDHFLPDERDLGDLILFGQKFARHLKYYDETNAQKGDWRVFFESDVTSALAGLAKLPVEAFRQFQADLERWLRADAGRTADELGDHFRLWFHLPLVLVEEIARHHARLPNDHPLAQGLPRLAARDLADPLKALIAWYRGALRDGAGPGADLLDDVALAQASFNTGGGGAADPRVRLSSTVAAAVFGRPAFSADEVAPGLLSMIPPGDWPGLYASVSADAKPFSDAIDPYPRIYDALTYNLLTRAVERLYQGVLRVRQDAAAALEATLTDFAAHPAHYGLWLAFLKLFGHARGELNRFTGRHMDHYLREVLQLRPRAPQPDRAHLTFGLAKGVERHLLERGTAFRAGKDGLGRTVTFTLDDDLVVNRGSVAMLSGIFLEPGQVAGAATLLPRAASHVASLDGLGEDEMPEEAPAFPPFGPAEAPLARVGFALADRRLFLREGLREVTIRAELNSRADTALQPRFRVRLSGEEGWFEPASVTVTLDNEFDEETGRMIDPDEDDGGKGGKGTRDDKTGPFSIGLKMQEKTTSRTARGRNAKAARGKTGNRRKPRLVPETRRIRMLQIAFTLAPTDPAVVPVDPDLHGTEHAPGVPVAEVVFDFATPASRRAYASLRNARIDRVTVAVTASGLKQLYVLAAGAASDPAKPFLPFGPRPRAGDTLILGSSEIFSKPIRSWSLNVDWKESYDDTSHFRARLAQNYKPPESILTDGVWVPAVSSDSGSLLNIGLGKTGVEIALYSGDVIDGLAEQTVENPPFDASAVTGFIRMALDEDFGHVLWPSENARAMVKVAKGEAYTRDSRFNYEGGNTTNNIGWLPKQPYLPELTRIEAAYVTERSAVDRLTLLAPFGVEEVPARLFPELPYAGALFVGVANFDPPAKLTLLIQVEDGSGDPLLPVPELDFAYLDGDDWTAFLDQDVDDKTKNLTTSGILGLALPDAAGTAHRPMPDGLTWVRISAPNYPDALNRLLAVTAQAGRATFADQGNDPERLETPVPAGTIAKMLAPVPQVKTVAQPFAGFGGRPPETPRAMDTRVAERLRHKDRAVTMWDVEALVLDAFPSLYRAKCLGLTELRRDTAGVVVADNELKPGAVGVVTVPWIAGGARDPLRPYTDQATLTAVHDFLRPRFSPFVRLEVTNPRLEEVHLDFKVRFKPGIADIAFYSDRLNQALVGYLTPWASGGGEITFGGKLWRSRVIDFLDEQPEVDFVTEVKMFHKIDITAPAGGWTPIPLEVTEATSARSILVSARSHVIREVPRNG